MIETKTVVSMDPKTSTDNIAMDTDYASKIAKVQAETLRLSMTIAFEQIRTLQLPTGSSNTTPVCFLDLGSADGLNSIFFFNGCVKELRKRDDDRAALLVFEDQPCNDFQRITALPEGTFGPNTFPLVSNTGFFNCTMPPGTVHLSFSSHSMHYLRCVPCNLKNSWKDTDIVDQKERVIFREAAEADWNVILLARAQELVPGGRSVISNLCVDEKTGWYYGSTDRGKSIFTELGKVLRSMVEDSLMTKEEFLWATSPEYYRTVEELEKPFKDANSVVRQAGLVLKSSELQVTRCPWRQEFMEGKHPDKQAYGKIFSHVIRAHACNKCARAFLHPGNTRTKEERRKLLDEVFERFAHKVANDPLAFGNDSVCLVMIIEKALEA